MNQKELLNLHQRLCDQGRALMEKKNSDYGADNDAFHNFRMAALLRIPAESGVLLRMQDKMARVVSYLEKGKLQVKDETYRDSLVDLINYSVILVGMLEEKRNVRQQLPD